MDYSKYIMQIAPYIDGVEKVYEYETDSSHSNFIIVCDCNGKNYMCKIVYDTALSGVLESVRYEFMALKIASDLGIAPKPVMYNAELNIVVSEFIESNGRYDISLEGVIDRAKYARILSKVEVGEMKFLEKHGSFRRDYEEHRRLLDEALAYASKIELSRAKDKIKEDVSLLKKEIMKFEIDFKEAFKLCLSMDDELNKIPFVLSHNDLVADNLLTTESGDKYIIDFETVGLSKADFIIGQLAVDAEIDWYLEQQKKERIYILYKELNSIFDNIIGYKLFLARVLERLVQNICYSYRQIAISAERNYTKEYINKKKQIILFGKKRLIEIKEKFLDE